MNVFVDVSITKNNSIYYNNFYFKLSTIIYQLDKFRETIICTITENNIM